MSVMNDTKCFKCRAFVTDNTLHFIEGLVGVEKPMVLTIGFFTAFLYSLKITSLGQTVVT